jgi:hypothetical protein
MVASTGRNGVTFLGTTRLQLGALRYAVVPGEGVAIRRCRGNSR